MQKPVTVHASVVYRRSEVRLLLPFPVNADIDGGAKYKVIVPAVEITAKPSVKRPTM